MVQTPSVLSGPIPWPRERAAAGPGPACQANNFARNNECFKCGEPKPAGAGKGDKGGKGDGKSKGKIDLRDSELDDMHDVCKK